MLRKRHTKRPASTTYRYKLMNLVFFMAIKVLCILSVFFVTFVYSVSIFCDVQFILFFACLCHLSFGAPSGMDSQMKGPGLIQEVEDTHTEVEKKQYVI